MENWQTVLFDSMRSDDQNPYIVSIFYIAWIFLGNFILLNLFLAILLDSFLEEEDEEDNEEEIAEKKRLKAIKKAEKKKRMDAKKILMDVHSNKLKDDVFKSKFFFGEAQNEDDEDLEDLDEDQMVKIFKDEGLIQKD